MSLKHIVERDIEELSKQIRALEVETGETGDISIEAATGKKSYAANCIRLDILRLKRDVWELAANFRDFQGIADDYRSLLEIIGDLQATQRLHTHTISALLRASKEAGR